jgi:hypothetical protein
MNSQSLGRERAGHGVGDNEHALAQSSQLSFVLQYGIRLT